MSTTNDSLWDEIPKYAWVGLGQRGMEQIQLKQCFYPKCNSSDENSVHVLNKEETETQGSNDGVVIKQLKFLIHCDSCKQDFRLIFEKHIDKENVSTEKPENAIVMERVFATDSEQKITYGDIGWIQEK